eukprot:TRINITY_DN66937_c3_g8_i2.p1 TRINITY_DN66937_c3_g8~~TRINITY_DN66937_c3_g8_i2.p1  ORF type:complete len:341 (+),score=24.56 TRINITY_DN66937_c3_g8_i2:31-1053(+)
MFAALSGLLRVAGFTYSVHKICNTFMVVRTDAATAIKSCAAGLGGAAAWVGYQGSRSSDWLNDQVQKGCKRTFDEMDGWHTDRAVKRQRLGHRMQDRTQQNRETFAQKELRKFSNNQRETVSYNYLHVWGSDTPLVATTAFEEMLNNDETVVWYKTPGEKISYWIGWYEREDWTKFPTVQEISEEDNVVVQGLEVTVPATAKDITRGSGVAAGRITKFGSCSFIVQPHTELQALQLSFDDECGCGAKLTIETSGKLCLKLHDRYKEESKELEVSLGHHPIIGLHLCVNPPGREKESAVFLSVDGLCCFTRSLDLPVAENWVPRFSGLCPGERFWIVAGSQ